MALPKHPDFLEFQQRMRRINPAFYPDNLSVDDQYGPGMAKGMRLILEALEDAHGLAPWNIQKLVNGRDLTPTRFRFLMQDPKAPLMVWKALDTLGTVETPGSANNSVILDWADEVGKAVDTGYANWAAEWYNKDSIPWCGLWMAVIAIRSANGRKDRFPPEKYLAAREWAHFGVYADKWNAAVGDIMVLERGSGGHVCIFVGMEEGGERFFGLGGNQRDKVSITPFPMERVIACRRVPYMNQPAGARHVVIGKSGMVSSTNEQ